MYGDVIRMPVDLPGTMKVMAAYAFTCMEFHRRDAPPASGPHSHTPRIFSLPGGLIWGLITIFLLSLLSLGGVSCCL
ncbi:MAG: hypothetical protein PWP08_429 [Methanofollis sp.]|nr:hypothetical protein [Methanofollis sp.]